MMCYYLNVHFQCQRVKQMIACCFIKSFGIGGFSRLGGTSCLHSHGDENLHGFWPIRANKWVSFCRPKTQLSYKSKIFPFANLISSNMNLIPSSWRWRQYISTKCQNKLRNCPGVLFTFTDTDVQKRKMRLSSRHRLLGKWKKECQCSLQLSG
jgi:hypothetical protein